MQNNPEGKLDPAADDRGAVSPLRGVHSGIDWEGTVPLRTREFNKIEL